MAFSQEKYQEVSSRPFLVTKTVIKLDDEVPGDVIAVEHYGPEGRAPLFCLFRVIGGATDVPTVAAYDYDVANDEVDVTLGMAAEVTETADAIDTADYDGAEIEMLSFFVDVAESNRS
jgi:hypothetical protein